MDKISSKQQAQNATYLTEIKEIPLYKVEEDEYFDYEKQYKEMMKNKQKKTKVDYSAEGNRMPSISMRLLDEAINQNILPMEKREKLIRNPNKYSIFFCKFNCDSPNMRKAMQQKGLTQKDLDLLSLEKFEERSGMSESAQQKAINTSVNQDYLKKLIYYLSYVTEHYEKLKDLLNYRQQLKKRQKSEIQYTHENSTYDSKLNQTYSEQNGSLIGRFNQSFIDMNKSVENSIITFEDRVKEQKKRSQKEQEVLGKYVRQFLETTDHKEREYNRSVESLQSRMKNSEKIYQIQLLKKQKEQKQKLEKVFERVKVIQERKEEKIMNKFKRMDFLQDRAFEKKQLLEKEREEFIRNNNNLDSKLLQIKEKQNLKEERIEDERQQLQKQIDEKQMKSAQLIQSVQNLNRMRVQEQQSKYNQTMDNIAKIQKQNSESIIQTLILSHLDIESKMKNKLDNYKKVVEERAKYDKKKVLWREKTRTKLERYEEKKSEKMEEKMEKHQERIEQHRTQMVEKSIIMHEKLDAQIRKVQQNKSLKDLQAYELQSRIIEKNELVTQRILRKKELLEQFKESSRSISLSLATKKQEILSKLY